MLGTALSQGHFAAYNSVLAELQNMGKCARISKGLLYFVCVFFFCLFLVQPMYIVYQRVVYSKQLSNKKKQ